MDRLDMLTRREQLIEHIKAIIDDNLGLIEYKDEITKQLSDAVCFHFPAA